MEEHPSSSNQWSIKKFLAAFRGMQFKKSVDNWEDVELRNNENNQNLEMVMYKNKL